jgi:transposase
VGRGVGQLCSYPGGSGEAGESGQRLDHLTAAQRDGIVAVAMDMWEPYVQSTRAYLSEADAKIVFDKFHVVKHLHDAVDQVRRREHRTLKRRGMTGSPGPSTCGSCAPRR